MKDLVTTMNAVEGEILEILVKCECAQYYKQFQGVPTEKFLDYSRNDLETILPADVNQEVIDNIEKEIRKAKTQKENDYVEIVKEIKGKEIIKEELSDDDETDDTSTPVPPNDSSREKDCKTEIIKLNPRNPKEGFEKIKKVNLAHVRITGQRGGAHKCDRDDPTKGMLTQWTDGWTKWGHHIHTLCLSRWTWNSVKSSCPWNLFTILTQKCPFIKKLSIEGPINPQSGDQIPKFPLNFTLAKLETLVIINHKGDLATSAIQQILSVAINLHKINFHYGNLEDVNSFLTILQDFSQGQPATLESLSITSFHESGHLTDTQIQMLAQVEATSLKKLKLGHGLSENVKGSSMEEILGKFKSSLKKFKVIGCFQGDNDSEVKPDILINIPKMVNLEIIDICGTYVYESILEDSHRPPKKIRKGSRGQRIINSEKTMKPFPITLKFPILPKLKHLELGSLFSIRELHFANFPKLEKFYVSCRWDLSVIFPREEKSRGTSYPLLNGLQLPDHLDDPNFVKMIPQRFPNLECCIINLATVKVLRTFFSVMADSKLEGLNLCTQFDFRSTMDICLLDKPSQVSLHPDDVKKIRLLKEYERWEEFVKFYNIQLPPDDLSSLEEEGMAGLSSLRKLEDLKLTHHPRILRIRKGKRHWTDPKCRFTREEIGFRKYPWPIACEKMRYKLACEGLRYDDYLNFYNAFRITKKPKPVGNAVKVQQSAVKVEVKDEN